MPSMIDVTKPQNGEASTADQRANWVAAASEISALQESQNAAKISGSMEIGTAPISMMVSVGEGAPTASTPGFDKIGSTYSDATGSVGACFYVSGGDGTWAVIG
jgi:hypothetical protein